VTWVECFGGLYPGAVVLGGTDNAGNVFTVNRMQVNADDSIMAGLLSRLLAAADEHGLECLLWWCPRTLNGIADDLSKCPTPAAACSVARRYGLVLHTTEARDGDAPPRI